MRVLLAAVQSSSSVGVDLNRILSSSSSPRIEVDFRRLEGPDFDESGVLERIEETRPEVVILAVDVHRLDQACRFIESKRAAAGNRPFLIALEAAKPLQIARLLDSGASEFLVRPFTKSDVLPRIWRLVKHARDESAPARRMRSRVGLKQIIGRHPDFVAELKKLKTMAGYDATVLIEGETGTGKELCARAIHYLSPRSKGPFVPINCAAIPDDLVENELFGHRRGAFTGASEAHSGLIAEAEGGTLFLDEVSSLSKLAQAKLLRFLEDGEYRVLGSAKARYGDVRVVAASNLDLEAAAQRGLLRKDLFFRLKILFLRLPPLRRRAEDIPLLARHFLRKHCHKFRKPPASFSEKALERLILHPWPGNVRELEHVVERAVLMAPGPVIEASAISLPRAGAANRSFKEAKAKVIGDFEKNYIRRLLIAHCGNIAAAARAAKKDRRTFWELIRKHSIDVQAIKHRLALADAAP